MTTLTNEHSAGTDSPGQPLEEILEHQSRRVPVVLHRPAKGQARMLLLIGHGGYGHGREPRMTAIAHFMVSTYGAAVLLIDGPVHGRRRLDGDLDPETVKKDWRAFWHNEPFVDHMVSDWRAAVDWAQELVGITPVVYYGLSMGTLYGLPLMAEEPRIMAGVLGMWASDNHTGDALLTAARRVSSPVLFYLRLEDHLFSQEGQSAVFQELGSVDKVLVGENGRHVPPSVQTAEMLLTELVKRTPTV